MFKMRTSILFLLGEDYDRTASSGSHLDYIHHRGISGYAHRLWNVSVNE